MALLALILLRSLAMPLIAWATITYTTLSSFGQLAATGISITSAKICSRVPAQRVSLRP